MKKTITHQYERDVKEAHDLEQHTGPLGFISHSQKWYEVASGGKCPNCGITPEFEPYVVEEVIEVPDPEPVVVEVKPKKAVKLKKKK